MIKMLIIVGIFLLLLSSGIIIKDWDNDDDVKILSEDDFKEDYREGFIIEEQLYQGPVPLNYDLKHFRKTGETIKEDNS